MDFKYQAGPQLQFSCIRCGSVEIETDVIDPLGDQARREESCQCFNCGLEWSHYYWFRQVCEMWPGNVDFDIPPLPEFPEDFLKSLLDKIGK